MCIRDRLSLDLSRRYNAGERIVVRIVYGGTPHVAVRPPWDGGFMWNKTPDGQPWIATAVQLEGCDLFWPCFDNSLVEVPVIDLAITVPAGLSAPANGTLIGVDRHPDGRSTWKWRVKNANNYAIALNIAPYGELSGDYQSRYGNTIPLRFFYLKGREEQAKKLFTEFAPTLDFFEAMIGPYPFADEKLGVAETPHLGMEHQTMNAYGNEYRKTALGYDSLFQHEFGHEWFGNQLTNETWDDMWLHEGFDSYMQPLYSQWRGGDMPYMAELWKQRAGIANTFPIVSGTPKTIDQVYTNGQGPGGDIYAKGSWVLHTLRGLIGDKAFFTAVRRIVYGRPDPAPGNFKPHFATTDDFQAIVNEEAGQDLTWFFDVYLRRAALPKLVTERRANTLELRWETPDKLPFPMPIEIKVGDREMRLPMKDGTATVMLDDPASHVTLDPHGRILRYSQDIVDFQAWQKMQGDKDAAKRD